MIDFPRKPRRALTAAEERAATVAWLRSVAGVSQAGMPFQPYLSAANAIEIGAHLVGKKTAT